MDAVNSVSRRKYLILWHYSLDVVARRGAPCEGSVRHIGWGMTAERVDIFALAIGFAIAGCWSLVSGAVVVMGLRAFGITAG
jgi:hypothetical protein